MAVKLHSHVVVGARPPSVRDVIVNDRDGVPVRVGSIVEIAEMSSDRYRGLFYVVGFEASADRGVRFLLAVGRHDKWDFKVHPGRVTMRAY